MRISEEEETDIDRLLALTYSTNPELQREALECLGSTAVFIPTEQVGELFDRLLVLCDDPVLRQWAVGDLCQWFTELSEPGELFPSGYRSRVLAYLGELSHDRDPEIAKMARSALGYPGLRNTSGVGVEPTRPTKGPPG